MLFVIGSDASRKPYNAHRDTANNLMHTNHGESRSILKWKYNPDDYAVDILRVADAEELTERAVDVVTGLLSND